MTIFVGSDHRGFTLKNKIVEWLTQESHHLSDCGNNTFDQNDDWNDFADSVTNNVINQPESIGILVCGSGAGMSMASNRHRGARAALCFNTEQAKHTRVADRANIICLPAEYIDFETAKAIISAFIGSTPSQEERYARRAKKLGQ